MQDLEQRYWSYVRLVRGLLSMFGLWPRVNTPRNSAIQYFATCVYCFITFSMLAGVIYFCWFYGSNRQLLMNGCSNIGSTSLMAIKLVGFLKDRDRMIWLLDTLESLVREESKNPEMKPLLFGAVPIFQRCCYVQSITAGIATVLFMINPLIAIMQQKASDIVPVSYKYSNPIKFPWDEDRVSPGPVYVANYIYLMIVNLLAFCSIIGLDNLFGLYITLLCGQLKVLQSRFRNLVPGKQRENDFRECVKRYCLLIRCRDNIQEVYGPAILVQFVFNALIMCSLIYQTSQMVTITVGRATLLVCYFLTKIMQALMFSLGGMLLTTESENVTYAAYESDWAQLTDKKMMQSVLIVVSQRPLILTAHHFSVVSLHMLTAILNTTMSYFFLLQTLDDLNK